MIKPLPTEFPKNGLTYRIIERSETRYFAEIIGESGCIVGYETGRIMTQKARETTIQGVTVKYGDAEHIPGNEKFGGDRFEGFHPPKMKNDAYRNFIDGNEYDKIPRTKKNKHPYHRENEKVMV